MNHRLLTAEREQKIIELLKISDFMTVSALSTDLNVSEATMRRDLQSMHERGLLERIHGGATLQKSNQVELVFSDKEGKQSSEKKRIAKAALELIHDNDVIYLDGGSTVLYLARLLNERKNLTIVTNSLMAASILMEYNHRLILTGGELRTISRTLVGPLTAPVIQNINVNKAFMGTIGFTCQDGMTTTNTNEAFTKSQILPRSRQVILLADHSKLGLSSFIASGSLTDVNYLITDSIGSTFREHLEQNGITVIIAKE